MVIEDQEDFKMIMTSFLNNLIKASILENNKNISLQSLKKS